LCYNVPLIRQKNHISRIKWSKLYTSSIKIILDSQSEVICLV
jgi:hypothetical protein